MKKTFIIIVLLLSIKYLNNTLNIKQNNETFIETIKENALPFINQLENDNILLTTSEIKNFNEKTMAKTSSMYNLNNINNLTKKELLDLINKYKIPKLPKYNNNKEISQNDIEQILDNLNLNQIKETIIPKKALIITRSNLRAFPTDINFFQTKNTTNFDQLQETELPINTPVLITHESKDKNWNFIISEIYVGWIKNSTIAYATENDWNYFTNNKRFGVIIEPTLKIENLIFDMGVRLPYLKTNNNQYQLVIPNKDKNNNVIKKIITFNKEQVSLGYLPYTKKNIIIQAFKYEGLPYSWAGMNESVDCSSYILNIYKTFGFKFPRNTEDQKNSIGTIIWLTNKTNEEKLNIINNNPLSLLYQPGHVMLYLGKIENKHYIIHASGKDLKVIKTNLTESPTYLSKIDRIIII